MGMGKLGPAFPVFLPQEVLHLPWFGALCMCMEKHGSYSYHLYTGGRGWVSSLLKLWAGTPSDSP